MGQKKARPSVFRPMTGDEMETIRRALGFENRTGFAHWLGLGLRTVDGYVEGRSPIPKAMAMLLRLMIAGRVDPAKLVAMPPIKEG